MPIVAAQRFFFRFGDSPRSRLYLFSLNGLSFAVKNPRVKFDALRHNPIWQHAAAFALFVIATGILFFPLSFQIATHVPDWGDPLEYAWVLAWDAHALVYDPLQIYNANIFYPYPNALAFSESQIASAVLGLPLFFATYNPILSYNFVFLAALILSGFNAYLLAYDVTKQRGGALVAGFAFAFWAYKFNHISHVNLITLQWLPLVFFALRRSFRQDGFTFPILFAVTFLLQALSSWYTALMTMLVVALYAVYVLLFRRAEWKTRRVIILAIFFALALIPIIIIARPYFQVSGEMQFARALSEAERFSATPLSFLSVSAFNVLYQNLLPKAVGEALFPGALLALLALFGLGKKSLLADRAFWIFAIVIFGIIAFGPVMRLAPSLAIPSPLYLVLYEFVPGVQGTRAPARFFVVGMLGLVLLAANGFGSLTKNRSARAQIILTASALGILTLEYLALPIATVPIETGAQIPRVYQMLKQQPEGNVLEAPVRVGDIEPITRAIYFSIYHQRALPVGYASFIPPTQIDFLHTLNTALETPSPRAPNLLREFGVRYVIVNRLADDAQFYENAFAQLPSFELLHADETHQLYRINADAPAHPVELGCLAPAFAAPDAPYIFYLTAQHTRRYPIVNEDLKTRALTLTWRDDASVFTQTVSTRLPYVLRERVEGAPLEIRAPKRAGEYELTCALDGAPLLTQQVRVASDFEIREQAPPLELLDVSLAPTAPQRGGEIIATFFWRRRAETRTPVLMNARLENEQDAVVAELTRQPILYTYPVRLWRDNELVADAYALPIPADAPAGNYRVVIRALDEGTTARLSFINPRGETTTEFSTEPFSIPQ